jgi:hypothetical protein
LLAKIVCNTWTVRSVFPEQVTFSQFVLSLTAFGGLACAQSVSVFLTSRAEFPAPEVDGNSPGFWDDGDFRVFTSTGKLVGMRGSSVSSLHMDEAPVVESHTHEPMWIESVWRDDDGLVYAWYHHEPGGLCDGKLTAPEIGALVSRDRGHTFEDLGIVLASGDGINCDAKNGFFAGGHGDFSVILDREHRYFYFLFTNYGGLARTQGIALARMAFEDRANPLGAVYKFHNGEFSEPGFQGAVSAVFPAFVPWERSDANSFWGPAVHWNTALEKFVILMNHACCEPGWPQEGIFIAYASDWSDPAHWKEPQKLLDDSQIGFPPGFYPQVFGSGPGESDTEAGQLPRLFIKGVSLWSLFFDANPEPPPIDDGGQRNSGTSAEPSKKRRR